jgi:hypothetical protein
MVTVEHGLPADHGDEHGGRDEDEGVPWLSVGTGRIVGPEVE